MLSSNFASKKNASWTLPGGFLSAFCNINIIFGAHVGLQEGMKNATGFETFSFFWSNTTRNPKLSLISFNLSPKSEPKSMFLEVNFYVLIVQEGTDLNLTANARVICFGCPRGTDMNLTANAKGSHLYFLRPF